MVPLNPKFGQCKCKPFSEDILVCNKCETVFCSKCVDTRIRVQIENSKLSQMVNCCPKCVSIDLSSCKSMPDEFLKQARECIL